MNEPLVRIAKFAALIALALASAAFGNKEKIAAAKSVLLDSPEGVYFVISMDSAGVAFQIECVNPARGLDVVFPCDFGQINGASMTSGFSWVGGKGRIYRIFGVQMSGNRVERSEREAAITENCEIYDEAAAAAEIAKIAKEAKQRLNR